MRIVLLEPAEPDSPAMRKIIRIQELLEENGHEISRQRADSSLFGSVLECQPDVVFNLASIYGWERTNLIPGVLEITGIRYTGSGLLGLSLARNRTLLYPLLTASGIRIPPFMVMKVGSRTVSAALRYPVTLYLDGSRGGQVLSSAAEATSAVSALPADAEAVLQEVAQGTSVSQYLLDGAPFPSADDQGCLDVATKAFQLLEARGLARFDFAESDEPYLIGIETSPDPLDEHLLRMAASAGWTEARWLQTLVEHAGSDLQPSQRVALSPEG